MVTIVYLLIFLFVAIFQTTSMPDSSCCVVLVLAILGTGVILTVILVPLSLKTLEYYEVRKLLNVINVSIWPNISN